MKKLTYPAPAALDGESLAAELAAKNVIVEQRGISLEVPEGGTEPTILALTVADGTSPAIVAQAVAAHTGQPTATRLAAQRRTADAGDALGQLIALAGGRDAVRAKAKAMVVGTDAVNLATLNRIVGALMLDALRDREDS